MKALVVYESMFGNTALLARSIADGLAARMDVDVCDTADAPATTDGYDLVVAGGPTHALSMSRPRTRDAAIEQGGQASSRAIGLREWLGSLPDDCGQQPIATFDTRMNKARSLPGSAAKAAARVARNKSCVTLAPPASFYVVNTDGPLVGGELERAAAWGHQLSSRAATRRSETRRRSRAARTWWKRS